MIQTKYRNSARALHGIMSGLCPVESYHLRSTADQHKSRISRLSLIVCPFSTIVFPFWSIACCFQLSLTVLDTLLLRLACHSNAQ